MTEILTGLSDALAETVEGSGTSVVRVEARDRLPASGIAWPSPGIIVTAHHVVEREENIIIGLPSGETLEAVLVGRDPTTDLAVLRAPASDLAGSPWADTEDLRVGHLVLALGRPGKNMRATMGIVSALGTNWRTPAGGTVDRYLQTDVVMHPGFSGGPLVEAGGRVVGMNTSGVLKGISLAVPVPTVARVVDALLTHGKIVRAYIGVGSQPTRLSESLAGELGQQTGLLLVSVEAGSPAEKAGLFLGDTIVALAGNPVKHLDDLMSNLDEDQVGKSIPVRIARGGQTQDLSLVPEERPQG